MKKNPPNRGDFLLAGGKANGTLAEGIKGVLMVEKEYYCCRAFIPSAGAGNGVAMAGLCSTAAHRRQPVRSFYVRKGSSGRGRQ